MNSCSMFRNFLRRTASPYTMTAILFVLLSSTAYADNSTSCATAVQAQLTDGSFSAVEAYDGRDDLDYYRVRLPSAGLIVGRLLLEDGARYLRPRFQYNSLFSANCLPTQEIAITDPRREVDLVTEVNAAGDYVVIVTGSGTSRAAGEKYRLIISFVAASNPLWVRSVSGSAAEISSGQVELPQLLGTSGQFIFSPTEALQSGRNWNLSMTVSGTGVIIASMTAPDAARATFSTTYANSWNVPVGRGNLPKVAFVADGSLNDDLGLIVSLYSQYSIPDSMRLTINWIPVCALRQFPGSGSIGCPNRDLGADLPESARLKLEYGRLVTIFEVQTVGNGPIKISTGNSDFDPWLQIRSTTTGQKLGFDQDDGPGSEAWWIQTLPLGTYAAIVRSQNGYGTGYTTTTVDQSLAFSTYPEEYPDPPGDLASSYCSTSNPTIYPNSIFESGFESNNDVDSYILSVPDAQGRLTVRTLGYVMNVELRTLPPAMAATLISASSVAYPLGISRQTSGADRFCLVLSPSDRSGPYLIEYYWEPAAPLVAAQSKPLESAACNVPSRLLLDRSIRDSASCSTAWRAYIGRRRANARLFAAVAALKDKIEHARDLSPEAAAAKSLVLDFFSALDVRGSTASQEALFLYLAAVIPKEILGKLSNTAQQEFWFNLAGCQFDLVESVVTYYSQGSLAFLQAAGCPVSLLVGAVQDAWAALNTIDLQRAVEVHLVEWYFLDEWFSLGSIPNLSAKYNGATGPDLVKAIAESKGLAGRSLFSSSAARDARFAEAFGDIAAFALEDVVPRVEARLND